MLRTVTALIVLMASAVIVVGCGSTDAERGGRAGQGSAPPRLVDWTTQSAAVPGRLLHQYALVPRGRAGHPRPLLIMLHGFGNGSKSWVQPPMPALLASLGEDAPVVVAPDGGRDSWWLDRASGDWARYVSDEVIDDAVERFGIDPERVAVAGFSMGGFGAYVLAMHHPGRFCAVGGHDAAFTRSFAKSVRTQFDSRAHFAENDVMTYARSEDAFPDAQLWLDRGIGDAFIPGEDAFAAALEQHDPPIRYSKNPGIHSMRSVRASLEPAMAFYADALADCEQLKGSPRSRR